MAQQKESWTISIGPAALAVTLALSGAVMAQDRQLSIPRDKADCLIDIVELDAKLTTDPVILKLDDCPDIVASVDALKSSQLAASPGSPKPKVGKGLPILILTRREIACMLDQLKTDRDTNGGSDPARVDLTQCPES